MACTSITLGSLYNEDTDTADPNINFMAVATIEHLGGTKEVILERLTADGEVQSIVRPFGCVRVA